MRGCGAGCAFQPGICCWWRCWESQALARACGIWSIECWHWIRDSQLHEDAHRYRGNGAGALASLRTAALNLFRLAGFQSIRLGMQEVMHNITAKLAMRQPKPKTCRNSESALGVR